MRTTLTLKDKLLEAWQQMDWEKVAQLEQTNAFKLEYPHIRPEPQRPLQAEGVYLHEGGVTEFEYK